MFRNFVFGNYTYLVVDHTDRFECNVEEIDGIYRVRRVKGEARSEFLVEIHASFGKLLLVSMILVSFAFLVAYIGSGFEISYLLISLSCFVFSRLYIYATRPRALRLTVSELS